MKTAIVTDTNSGIPGEEAQKYGIYLLPMPVIIDGNSRLEGIDLQTEEFYEAQEKGCSISTSQPATGAVTDLWDSLFQMGYEEIVHIPMTSGLSGSCQSAAMLAEEYDSKVFVVDNHRISATQHVSALEAKRMADAGFSAKEIKASLEATGLQASIYLTVESLKYLQKGGRLSPSAAMLGTLLNIKPILSIQGAQIDAFAKMRGLKKCEKKMIEAIQNDIASRFSQVDPEKLQIHTAGTLQQEGEIQNWVQVVQDAFPDKEVRYTPLPCSIATHVGPGSFGIAVSVSEY